MRYTVAFVVSFFVGGFVRLSYDRYNNDCFAGQGGSPAFGCHDKPANPSSPSSSHSSS
jgi:hypothetical protein